MRKILLLSIILLLLSPSAVVLAHLPRIVYLQQEDVQIINPENSQAFYDELKGSPKSYFISSEQDFELYLNLLVPEAANRDARYSAKVFSGEQQITELDGGSVEWSEFYETFGRDYYLKGPELTQQLPAGDYRIEVFSSDNQGKYVLAIGEKEVFDIPSLLNIYWQLPLLKITFFKTSVLQFFLTPFGIAGIAALGIFFTIIAMINYLIALIKESLEHRRAKTILLTSAGMQVKDEIVKLLQKPAYNITVGFINTAAKPEADLSYVQKDLDAMKEVGFNVEEIDIEGKKESQVMELLKLKDIIYVEGGNTFYLLKAMRRCNFGRVIRKLLKLGKVYIGVSAGSIVAGRTIETAGWKNADKNLVGLRNLKGLNLVPFNIIVHYQPEHAEIIKQKIKSPRKRKRKLRILTDDQALLIQADREMLIGQGEEVII